MSAALVERSAVVVKRRSMLGGLFAVGAGIFGIVAAFPLIRSLGPLPKDELDVTQWRAGSVLVDSNGRPVSRDTLVVGGIMTVYPRSQMRYEDGQVTFTDQGLATDQTVLIRASDEPFTTEPGREGWTPDGYVAYSKLCTHLGCPVGLYEQELELLVCPCHQSMFNIRNGAVPQFGPGAAPAAADASGLQRRRQPDRHGALRSAGRTWLLGADDMSPTAAKTKRSAKKERGPYGHVGRVVGELDDRLGVAKGGRVFLDKIFPDHWSFMLGEIALYSFVVLLATGVFLALYFVPSATQVVYHGSYAPLRGQRVSEAYAVDGQHLLRRAGRPAHPPDAPLGGGHLHRFDHRAHGPHLLHRRLPQATRAQLDHRDPHALPGGARGLHRLLLARRPHFGHRPPHRLLHRRIAAPHRQLHGLVPVGWPVPGRRQHHPPLLHHPRADHPAGAHRAPVRAPGPAGSSEAHPVQGRGPDRDTTSWARPCSRPSWRRRPGSSSW